MADTARVHLRERLRRSAETLVILGLCLMAISAVAHAEDPTPTPTPVAVAVEVTPTPTPEPLATAIPTAEPTPTPEPEITPVPTPTVEPTVTPPPTPEPTATGTQPAVVLARPQPKRRPRQSATPTPTPSPTPESESETPDEYEGAALTLCHATENPVQPYVAVTVDANGFNPHFDHELDIIPAPPEGCGSIDDPDRAANRAVYVCHATGDSDRPYRRDGPFAVGDLDGHEGHKGDLIPAPNRTCPGLDPYAVPTATPTAEPTPTSTATATPTSDPDDPRIVDVIGVDDRSTPGDDSGSGEVAGVAIESGSAPGSSLEQLPFTGFDLWLTAAAGLGLALMGAGLRVLAAQPPLGVTR